MTKRNNEPPINNGIIVNGGNLNAKKINIRNISKEQHPHDNSHHKSSGNGNLSADSDASVPSSREIRRMLNEKLLGDSDLNAFIIDFFPDIWKHYIVQTMDRMAKMNVLLEQASAKEIFRILSSVNQSIK